LVAASRRFSIANVISRRVLDRGSIDFFHGKSETRAALGAAYRASVYFRVPAVVSAERGE